MWPRRSAGWSDPSSLPDPRLVLEVEGELAGQLLSASQARGLPVEVLANDLLTRAMKRESLRLRAEAALERLTPREREVIRMVVMGHTNRQIAAALVVSPETIKTHIRHALEKLGVRSKAELRLRLSEMGVHRWLDAAPKPLPARLPLDLDLSLR